MVYTSLPKWLLPIVILTKMVTNILTKPKRFLYFYRYLQSTTSRFPDKTISFGGMSFVVCCFVVCCWPCNVCLFLCACTACIVPSSDYFPSLPNLISTQFYHRIRGKESLSIIVINNRYRLILLLEHGNIIHYSLTYIIIITINSLQYLNYGNGV